MFDVVTIGSVTRDHFLRGNFKLIPYPDTPLRKAITLPFGEKLHVEGIYATLGGNAANASVTFARYGWNTACVAKIGHDLEARAVKEKLQAENVETRLLRHTAARPTAFSVLLVTHGERTILGYHGASDTFRKKDLVLSKLKAKWWYISLAGESDAMHVPLIAHAARHNIRVACNPSGHHIRHRRNEIVRSLRNIAVLILNTGEAAQLVRMSFREERAVFRALDKIMSPGIVAVTDGKNGVTVSDGVRLYRARTFREKVLVDRTGAGDAFGSGFVAALMEKKSIPEAIRFASANATSVVERVGATEGTLTRREFERSSRWKKFPVRVRQL